MQRDKLLVQRQRICTLIGCCLVTLIFVRLSIMMLVQGSLLRERADMNRTFTQSVSAPRGIIYDRNHIAMTANVPLYKQIVGDETAVYPTLIPVDEHVAYTLLLNTPEKLVQEQNRSYVFGDATAHVLGYVGQSGQMMGKMGVERQFDAQLQGVPGTQEFERNAQGKLTRLSKVYEPVAGKNVTISIDAHLNTIAFDLLQGRKGAVVVSDVASSQVLALVSSPAFNPSNIVPALSDAQTPLLNRALQAYPPGSVFKMITALAGLKGGTLTKDTLLHDDGEIKVGDASFRNWYFTSYGKTEGDITVVRALTSSNDVFFYKAAQAIGPDGIAAMARAFHLGSKTNLGLIGEQEGIIPTPAWKEKVIGEKWYLGDTYHMGIGQGDVLVSPLQLNAMTAALARRGIWCRPTLQMEIAPECGDVGVTKADIEIVTQGMVGACSHGGTAFPFFADNAVASDSAQVACKTGTAEHGAKSSDGRRSTDAWLTLFYPNIDPKVAITVMLESDGNSQFLEGSADAAPIARGILEAWKKEKW